MYLSSLTVVFALCLWKIEANYIAICDGDTGYIKCGAKTSINIVRGNFGRTDANICSGKTIHSNCSSAGSQSKLKWACNGNQMCKLDASVYIFGDPCPGVSKYLEVEYECVTSPNCVMSGKRYIAFTAAILQSRTEARNTYKDVVYDDVITNEGNAYNSSTGFFTAPGPGLYVFQWVTLVDAGKIYDTEIHVNRIAKVVCNCNNESGFGYVTCTGSAPFVLKTGDVVNIHKRVGNFIHGNKWSSFSGWKAQ